MGRNRSVPLVEDVRVDAYRIPTEGPEEDGSLAWDSTVLVVVEIRAGDLTGIGYTYADRSTAVMIMDKLADAIRGADILSIGASWFAMRRCVRNLGQPGIASMAISAVDNALWDLKAKFLGQSLVGLLGQVRASVPAYGSGGFTNYDEARFRSQMEKWMSMGIRSVKMKVGSRPEEDPARVRFARSTLGTDMALFVDANGSYSRKQALAMAALFAESGVSWFEEPVPEWDVEGTRSVCVRMPDGMDMAGGEYGYRLSQFLSLLRAGAVDCLQADATRCGGITGFLSVSALCEAFNIPLSSHCAPTLHQALGCALGPVRHLEYFHDHVLIEEKFFEGFRAPVQGMLAPDPERLGMGIEFKRADAEKFAL